MDSELQQLVAAHPELQLLAKRLSDEEKRNQYLVAWLWEFGNTTSGTLTAADARRLALACDPTLVWPPAQPAAQDASLPPQ